MIQSILVPMDGLPAAYSALENAIDLARIAGAEVRGLFVEDEGLYVPPVYATPVPEPIMPSFGAGSPSLAPSESLVKEWEQTGQQLRTRFDQACAGVGVKGAFTVVRGMARKIIIERARTVDLVVMGRRGAQTAGRPEAPGSHTEALLMATTRPVLVVPAGGRRTNRILIAYDGSRAARRALDFGATLTKLQVSKVDVLCAASRPEDADGPLEEAKQFLAAYNADVCFVVKSGHPALAISQHALQINAGLIVMGAYGHSRLAEMIFGSTTRGVLTAVTCPVLLAS